MVLPPETIFNFIVYCIVVSHVTASLLSPSELVTANSPLSDLNRFKRNSSLEMDPGVEMNSLCPSLREEAAARGRSCLRKCRSDADCISNRKRCLCDGLCGWSCVRPDLNCEELPRIANGSLQVSGDYFGARVVYTCDDGFFMSGARERVCQGDATWSNAPPICREKAMCGPVMSVPHARDNVSRTHEEFHIHTIVRYDCFVGYQARGSPFAQCLYDNHTALWSGPHLKCLPLTCGDPGFIDNASREVTSFTFTSKVTYTCVSGYEMIGEPVKFCQSNGQWSAGAGPSCEKIKCSPPPHVSHGRITQPLDSLLEYNSTLHYVCDYGFKLEGNSTIECGQNKEWSSPPPQCLPIDCGHPGFLANGQLIGDESTTINSVIGFKCNTGMTLISAYNSTTCLISGTWSHPLPSCMAPCLIDFVENGRVSSHPPGQVVPHAQDIVVDCKPQYELQSNDNTSPIKCDNGTWTRPPVCVPKRCKQLPEKPKDGLVIAPRTEHGMRALYQCNDGFMLIGSNVTTCNYGRWTAPLPVCQEFYCPFPGLLANGSILLVGHMGMYEYRDYVKKISHKKQIVYQCNKGFYVSGPSGATCVDGQWSPSQLPQCLLGSYPTLDWLQKRRRRSSRSRASAHVTKSTRASEEPHVHFESLEKGQVHPDNDSETRFLMDMIENDHSLLDRLHSLDEKVKRQQSIANAHKDNNRRR